MDQTSHTPSLAAHGDPPPAEPVEEAAALLREGLVVAIPTDTVYGFAVDPFRPGAADRVFALKGRPRGVDLAVLVAGRDQLDGLVDGVPDPAEVMIRRFWPGALTIVLRRRADLDVDLGTGNHTIGVRWPRHPVPQALCRAVGPLAVTSANRHGAAPATQASAVLRVGPGIGLVLDAGSCRGTPSTVVDCTGQRPRVLRQGAISAFSLTDPV